jgi:hypothetical protein
MECDCHQPERLGHDPDLDIEFDADIDNMVINHGSGHQQIDAQMLMMEQQLAQLSQLNYL